MPARRAVEPLTQRQQEVLSLLARGCTNFEIAQALGISLDGAKWHVREVLGRLGVESREEAAAAWAQQQRDTEVRRLLGWFTALPLLKVGGAAAAGVALVALVGTLVANRGGGGPAVADPSATANSSPSAASVLDRVIEIGRSGDAAGFQQLMRMSPEPCSSAGPVACPAGTQEGTPVDAFYAFAGGQRVATNTVEPLVADSLARLRTLHAVVRAAPSTFGSAPPSTRFAVVFRGGSPIQAVVYLVDDSGIVGLHVDGLLPVDRALDGVAANDWLVIRPGVARLQTGKPLYVVGQDSEIRFEVVAPTVCAGHELTLQLYVPPYPGVAGGVQEIREQGLTQQIRQNAHPSGLTVILFPLPATISGPMEIRASVSSWCFGEPVFGGPAQPLAIRAPAEDGAVSIFELRGAWIDISRGQSGTFADYVGGALIAMVGDTSCVTVPLDGPERRNARGNVEFRIGDAGQPAACSVPGETVHFLGANGVPLAGSYTLLPGVIQLIPQLGPVPPR